MEEIFDDIAGNIYQYFPKGLSPEDEAFANSPEIQQLQQRCAKSEAERNQWNRVIQCLEQKLDLATIIVDWSQLHTLDRCYRLSILLDDKAGRQKVLVASMSIIAPYYVFYISERSVAESGAKRSYSDHKVSFEMDDETIKEVIIQIQTCIHQFFDVTLLPQEIGQRIVPDISLENTPNGNVTVFKAIFSDHFI